MTRKGRSLILLVRILLLAALCAMLAALFAVERQGRDLACLRALTFSSDGQQLAGAYRLGGVRVWDLSQPDAEPISFALGRDDTHWGNPFSVQFAGPRLLVAKRTSRSGEIPDEYELWDTAAGRRVGVHQLPYRASSLFYVSKEGGLALASAEEGSSTLDLFELDTGKRIGSLKGAEEVPGKLRNQYAISANGQRVAASFHSFSGESSESLAVWDTASLEQVNVLSVESGHGLAISEDGRFLTNSAQEVWDLDQGEKLANIDAGKYAHCDQALSPDGKMLALCSYHKGTVKVWDTTTGERIAELDCAADTTLAPSRYTFAAFSPDGATLAAGTDGTLKLWGTADFRLIATLAEDQRLTWVLRFFVAFLGWPVAWALVARRSHRPDPEAPRWLWILRALLGLSGFLAINWSTYVLFVGGVAPYAGYYGLVAGVVALAQALAPTSKGLTVAGYVQIPCILNFNLVSPILGAVVVLGMKLLTRKRSQRDATSADRECSG